MKWFLVGVITALGCAAIHATASPYVGIGCEYHPDDTFAPSYRLQSQSCHTTSTSPSWIADVMYAYPPTWVGKARIWVVFPHGPNGYLYCGESGKRGKWIITQCGKRLCHVSRGLAHKQSFPYLKCVSKNSTKLGQKTCGPEIGRS